MSKLLIALLAIVMAGCATIEELALNESPFASSQNLSSFEVQALLKKGEVVIIDVRSPAERQKGLIKGPVQVQFGPDKWGDKVLESEEQQFVQRITSIAKPGQEIVLFCQFGVRSEFARLLLQKYGINARSVQDGYLGNTKGPGIKAWDI